MFSIIVTACILNPDSIECPAIIDELSPLNAQHLLSKSVGEVRRFFWIRKTPCNSTIRAIDFGEDGVCTNYDDANAIPGLINCELNVTFIVGSFSCEEGIFAAINGGSVGYNMQAITTLRRHANDTLSLQRVKIGRKKQIQTETHVPPAKAADVFEVDRALTYMLSLRDFRYCMLMRFENIVEFVDSEFRL
nr:unnamed protein product [Spirometra erinaceieuropaei]